MKNMFRLQSATKDFFYGIGLLGIGVITFISVAAIQHSRVSDMANSGFIVHASFGRTDGLHIGDNVRIAGVNVGKIIDANLDNKYRVDLTLRLEKNYQIPEDSSAAIESDSILGAKYIDISLGAEDTPLDNGGHILYTQDAMVIEELIDMVISYAKSNHQQPEPISTKKQKDKK